MSAQRGVSYVEYFGRIERVSADRPAGDVVVLSNLERAEGVSSATPGICLRYVARGRESYRIGDRGIHLSEAQVMIGAQDLGAEVNVSNADARGTLGLCVLLPREPDDLPWLSGPLVGSAACSPLGTIMERCVRDLYNPTTPKQEVVAKVALALRCAMPSVVNSVLEQSAAMDAAKVSTKHEMVRRAHLAQAYLHSTVTRLVGLDELAKAVGSSPFQLLRAFQRCFGETPADYHRRLRLNAVVQDASRRKISLAAAAQDFGFADGSSFSHAYRRAFGQSAVWSKTPLN